MLLLSRQPSRRHAAGALGLIAALCALGAPIAQAAGPSFSLRPAGRAPEGFFHFLKASPGATISRSVRVVNVGDRQGTVGLSAVDAITGATTGAVYQGPREARAGVGGWISLSQGRVTLAPGASAVVRLTLRIPGGMVAGQHLGGIVARPVQPAGTRGTGTGPRSFSVRVVEQSILAVQVDVRGAATEALAIGKIRGGSNPGYQQLLVGLTNTGNQLLKGDGKLVIARLGGTVLKRQAFALDTFVPATTVAMPIVLRGKRLPAGRYRATITITYGLGNHVVSSTQLFGVSAASVTQAYGVLAARSSGSLPGKAAGKNAGQSLPIIGGGALALLLIAGAGFVAVRSRRQARALSSRLARLESREGEIEVADERRSTAPEDEPAPVHRR